MTLLEYLERWTSTGAITGEQYRAIAAIARQDRFSVFVELNALLYLGVVSFVAGAGWTIQAHFARLGDVAVLTTLTIIFLSSLSYCAFHARPYSREQVESSGFAFDYVLYLGCLVLGVELGYVEFRFHLLQANWDHYLLLSSAVFFVLAYRFDNRFVLSLALSTLAGWFGLRLSRFPLLGGRSLRAYALGYGGLVAMAGAGLHATGIKKHFLEAYLHVAVNVLFVALLSAIVERELEWLYMLGLLSLASAAIVEGVRFKRFAFVVYGVAYGYIGISSRVIRAIESDTAILAYLAASGTIVVLSLVVMARQFGREE
jgi:hypothetical protein